MLSRNRDYNLPSVNPVVCTIASGTITLHEHAAVTWLPKEDLAALDWTEADLPVLASYCRFAGQGQVTS